MLMMVLAEVQKRCGKVGSGTSRRTRAATARGLKAIEFTCANAGNVQYGRWFAEMAAYAALLDSAAPP